MTNDCDEDDFEKTWFSSSNYYMPINVLTHHTSFEALLVLAL